MKGRVIKLVKEKDNVVRGAIIIHNNKILERPLQPLCPLEICSEEPMTESEQTTETTKKEVKETFASRSSRSLGMTGNQRELAGMLGNGGF